MIGRDEVTACGSILRSHGVDGEVVVPVSADFLESTGMPHLVIDMDGILVPYFIESFRPKSQSLSLVKFEDIDSLEQADVLRGRKLWMMKKYIGCDEDEFSAEMFIGLRAEDLHAGYLGVVDAVDDSTANILFRVRDGERERILPASAQLIESVDMKKGVIVFDLPEGLADM
ncbi:MAG: ribosome maturation factor RimM [Bacteroidaceae bacterium]|nr:ribosome maturation factor RimM [Bacteroidaceae bacterium]